MLVVLEPFVEAADGAFESAGYFGDLVEGVFEGIDRIGIDDLGGDELGRFVFGATLGRMAIDFSPMRPVVLMAISSLL